MTEEAQRQARAERTWWRAHRDEKHIFTEELREARIALSHAPKHEIYGYFDGLPVRRLLMAKTRCHVYYVVLERGEPRSHCRRLGRHERRRPELDRVAGMMTS